MLQAEHERAQSHLFELREHKDAASNVVASAADLASEEHEALRLRVRQDALTSAGNDNFGKQKTYWGVPTCLEEPSRLTMLCLSGRWN